MAPGGTRQGISALPFQEARAPELPDSPLKKDDLFAKRYLISESVAVGPLGFVFTARDRALELDVSLSLLAPHLLRTQEQKSHFHEVMRLGRTVNHPGLSRLYDSGTEGEWVYFTSQRVEGLSLRKIIDRRVSKGLLFTLKEAEPICAQVLAVLAEAHQVGPHGDLHPDNVVVLPDLLKVRNFGLGVALPRPALAEVRRASNRGGYGAPEQNRGEDVGPRADLYAVGVILGEMLTGRVPADEPSKLGDLYLRAVGPRPEDRFPSALAFAEALAKAVGQSPPSGDRRTVNFHRPAGQEKPAPPVPEPFGPEPLTVVSAPTELSSHLPPPPPFDASGAHVSAIPLSLARKSPRRARSKRRTKRRRLAFYVWLGALAALGVAVGSGGGWLAFSRRGRAVQGPVSLPPVAIPRPPMPAPPPLAAAQPSALAEVRPPRREVNVSKRSASDGREVTLSSGPVVAAQNAMPAVLRQGFTCPEGMRLIPAGAFRMGAAADDPMRSFDERSMSPTDVTAFCIDLYEYPNRKAAVPTAFVSWSEAKQLCEAQGKRLCAEREWEKACKGPAGLRFAYGNDFNPAACNTQDDAGEDRRPSAAGQFERCRSGYGISDLSGNLAEWTASPFAAGAEMTQKGGAFNRPDYASRCAARKSSALSVKSAWVGFRCCVSAVP